MIDGDLQTFDGNGILGTYVNIALFGTYGVTGNGHSLHHREGITFQDRTVHKGTGITLISITADILHSILAGSVGGKLPLHARGEACAAAAAQARGFDHVNNLLRRDILRQNLAQSSVAIYADVLFNAFRIDHAAVAQSNAVLMLVKSGLGQGCHLFSRIPLHVQQTFDDAAFDDVLLHDFCYITDIDVGIAGTFGVHHNNRTNGTQTEAAGFDHTSLLVHAMGNQFLLKFFIDPGTVGGGTTCACTNQNVGTDKAHTIPLLTPPNRWYIPPLRDG